MFINFEIKLKNYLMIQKFVAKNWMRDWKLIQNKFPFNTELNKSVINLINN